jgi:hypothetical protein
MDALQEHISVGIITVPKPQELSQENLLKIKTLLDLVDAGIAVVRVPGVKDLKWQAVSGVGETEGCAFCLVDGLLSLSPELDAQAIVYNTDAKTCRGAAEKLRNVLECGEPITASSLQQDTGHRYATPPESNCA